MEMSLFSFFFFYHDGVYGLLKRVLQYGRFGTAAGNYVTAGGCYSCFKDEKIQLYIYVRKRFRGRVKVVLLYIYTCEHIWYICL
jgi:hypothetical protein